MLQRIVGILSLVCLLGLFGFAWSQADQCSHSQTCGGYYKPKNGAPGRTVPESADDRIADYTWWLAAFTLALVSASIFQGYFLIRGDRNAKDAADAALAATAVSQMQAGHLEQANKITRDHFALATRPWVSVQIKPTSDLIIMEDNRYVLGVGMLFKNYGKSPAFNISGKIVFIRQGVHIERVQNEIKDYLASFKPQRKHFGRTIFPDEEVERFESQIQGWTFVDGAKWGQWKEDETVRGGYIVGYFSYEFPFEGRGETRVAYMLAKDIPSRMGILDVGYGFDEDDRKVSKTHLIFYPWGGMAI